MTIFVLLDASTRMVRSALQAALSECDDIELVEASPRGPPRQVDVVVLQEGMFDRVPLSLRAIASAPRIGVVAIDEHGEAGDLYRVYHSCWQFAASGNKGLADAIRAVASAT